MTRLERLFSRARGGDLAAAQELIAELAEPVSQWWTMESMLKRALREADDLIAHLLLAFNTGPLTEFEGAKRAHDARMQARKIGAQA